MKGEKASLTVEAVFVLPLFVFGVLALLYFLQVLYIQEILQEAMTAAAEESSVYAFVYDDILGEEESEEEKNGDEAGEKTEKTSGTELVNLLLEDTYFKMAVSRHLDRKILDTSCIEGGYAGISFLGSSYMGEEDKIILTAVYGIRVPLPFISPGRMLFCQKVQTRGFVGSTLLYGEAEGTKKQETLKENEEMVYVTETGSCYHKSGSCSCLKLKIIPVSYSQIGDRRNNGGGKYYPCQKCVRNGEKLPELLYIALEGDRYHTSLSCPGLKRSVRQITITEALKQGKRGCKRCGG